MADIIPVCEVCSRPRYGLQQPGITHLHCQTCLNCGLTDANCQCPSRRGGREGYDSRYLDGHPPSSSTALTVVQPGGHYGDVADEWEDLMGMGAHVVGGIQTTRQYPSGAPGGVTRQSTSVTPTAPYVRCDHIQDPFKVGQYKLLITGGHDIMIADLKKLDKGEGNLVFPDLGMYLDSGWKSKLERDKKRPSSPTEPKFPKIEAFGGALGIDLTDITGDTESVMEAYRATKAQYDLDLDAYNKGPKEYMWPFLWVEWPDRGIVAVEVAERLVTFILGQLEAGKVLDVGCAGAHGRTGTLLAMLLIDAEGLTPEQAIRQVRKRHCHKAVESEAQVKAIFGYGGLLATEKQAKELASKTF